MSAARSEILHVRLTSDERERLRLVAAAEYLDLSTWARRAILQAIDKAEKAEARRRPGAKAAKGAEPQRPPRRRA